MFDLDILDSIPSTNDYLKGFVSEGKPKAAVAREQTAGKGRGEGRVWMSPRDQGLYCSFLFFPSFGTSDLEDLNRLAAVSLVEVTRPLLAGVEAKVEVKMPNDVLVNGKKLAGVLVELSSLGESINWAIVGMGVNLLQTEFSKTTFNHPPTSLLLSGGPRLAPLEFYRMLSKAVSIWITRMDNGEVRQLRSAFAAEL